VNLGVLFLRKARYEDAKNALLQATTIKPQDAVAQTHLGIAYRNLGEFKKAEQSYQEALRADPNYAYAHLNAGILYDIYLQKLPEALQHYEQYKALSKDSNDLVEKWIIDLKRRVGKNS
jgi:Flp pilus assembly protein TadD